MAVSTDESRDVYRKGALGWIAAGQAAEAAWNDIPTRIQSTIDLFISHEREALRIVQAKMEERVRMQEKEWKQMREDDHLRFSEIFQQNIREVSSFESFLKQDLSDKK
jgi:hypothetical protein